MLWLLCGCVYAARADAAPQDVCTAAQHSGDEQRAWALCQAQLSDLVAQRPDDRRVAQLHLQLAALAHAQGLQAEEDRHLQAVRAHPEFTADVSLRYEWHRRMGQRLYFQGDYTNAAEQLRAGLALARQENDGEWLGKSLNDVGLVETRLGQFRAAMQHHQESLEYKRLHGTQYQVGKTLNNLGVLHMQLEEYPEAAAFYRQALEAYLAYTAEPGFDERVYDDISHIYEDFIQVYAHLGSSQKAAEYVDAVLLTFSMKDSPMAQARALINVASWHVQNGSDAPAQRFLQRALGLHQNHDFDLRGEIYELMLQLHRNQSRAEEALLWAEQGLAWAQQNQDAKKSAAFHRAIGELTRHSAPQQAMDHLLESQRLREEFLNQKYDRELRGSQHRIEMQQVEAELMQARLRGAEDRARAHELANAALLAAWVALLALGMGAFALFKRRKERESLLRDINHHKQQLLLLGDVQPASVGAAAERPNDVRKQFHRALVACMVDALSIWEKVTGENRVELAEQSRVWTVSIDSGTLRTRSLDKYLSLDKLPANPRWRNVVRTCHFILAEVNLPTADRAVLNQRLDRVMECVKTQSLTH